MKSEKAYWVSDQKKITSICLSCKHCVHYLSSEGVGKNDKFNILGHKYGQELFVESGVMCGIAGVKIKMDILQCEKFDGDGIARGVALTAK